MMHSHLRSFDPDPGPSRTTARERAFFVIGVLFATACILTGYLAGSVL